MTQLKGTLKKVRGSGITWDRVDRVGNVYRLGVLGDLNGWVGDRVRVGITGSFGILGENDNGRRVIDFCAERGLCVGNTYSEHKNLHK